MTKLCRTLAPFLVAVLLIAGTTLASVLEHSVEAPRTRPLSRFDHDPHNEVAGLEEACALCHHLFDEKGELMEEESSEGTACRECHDSGGKGTPKTEAAFHNRCKGCHLAIRQGPITCGQCHAKKER